MFARSQIPAQSTQGVTFFFMPSILTNECNLMGYMHETPSTNVAYFFPCSLSLEDMGLLELMGTIDAQFHPGNEFGWVISKQDDPEGHRSV